MIHYKNFVRPQSLQEAYELNQKKSAVIAGGFCFLRMENKNVQTLLDLSGLLSDAIEEDRQEFRIGAMVSLRELEKNKPFNRYTSGAAGDCVRHIVGTQFRNCATVGGSIYGRFGFSDVLTMFLALDAYAELYRGGSVPLSQFAVMKPDCDILTGITVKKTPVRAAYESMRNEAVDFPVLSVAAAEYGTEKKTVIAVGARPARAERTVFDGILSELEEADRKRAAAELAGRFTYGTNMRGSGEYRKYLAGVLIERAALRAGEEEIR